MCCPPTSAWRLAKAMPKAKLHIVLAGHRGDEPKIREKLREEINKMYRKIIS